MELPAFRGFRVLGTLGAGGQGTVYAALDLERQLRVAVKTVVADDAERMLRFKQEFRAVRDLRHRNLVTLGELHEDAGRWFFTMELVEGLDFISWVRRGEEAEVPFAPTSTSSSGQDGPPRPQLAALEAESSSTSAGRTQLTATSPTLPSTESPTRRWPRKPLGPLDVRRLRSGLAQLAAGLEHLHRAGKVHRDLKPSNLLVTAEGRVVLIDFGVIAEMADPGADHGRLIGSISYMAPEQVRGEDIGPQADYYAVGVLLFQALTGRLPFEGPREDVVHRKVHLAAPAPSLLASDTPPDLDALCVHLLERDPGRRAGGAELARVVEWLDEGGQLAAGEDVFVGRKDELSTLHMALDEVQREGHAVGVVLEGDSGVGKSAIARQFLRQREDRSDRLVVLAGRCHEQERVPYNLFDAAIDALARQLGRWDEPRRRELVPEGAAALAQLFPVLRDSLEASPGELGSVERLDSFLALRELLAKLARRRPVVLLLEDLHWADADSLALLEELTREPGAPALSIVTTCRPGEAGRPASALASLRCEQRRLRIGGLPREDADTLARACLAAHGASEAGAATLTSESSGHPMFIEEMARQLASGATQGASGLDGALWARAEGLSAGTRGLLAAVAVAGAPTSQAVIAEAAGLAGEDFAGRLDELRAARLVRAHGPRPADLVEPYHDRVRESLIARLPAETQLRLHARLGSALEAAGAPPEVLLAHFDAAGDVARAASYAEKAAEAAMATLAYDRAVLRFRRALRDVSEPLERRRLLALLGEALAHAGRPGEAGETFLEASQHGDAREVRLDLLRRAAEKFLTGGHLGPGLAATGQLLADLGMSMPASQGSAVLRLVINQARLDLTPLTWKPRPESQQPAHQLAMLDVCWSAGSGLSFVDTAVSNLFATRGTLLALKCGEPFRVTRAVVSSAIQHQAMGRKARSQKLCEAAALAAAQDGRPMARFYAEVARHGFAFLIDNDWGRAFEGFREVDVLWRGLGFQQGWEIDVIDQFAVWSLSHLGRLRALRKRVPQRILAAQRAGNRFIEVSYRAFFSDLYLVQDRPEEARRDCLDAISGWLPENNLFGNQDLLATRSLTQIACYAGDAEEQLASVLAERWRRYERSLLSRVSFLREDSLHVLAALDLTMAEQQRRRGAPGEAKLSLARARGRLKQLARIDLPLARANLARLRACLAAATCDREGLPVLLRQAIGEAVGQDSLHLLAALKWRLASVLGGSEGAQLKAEADAWLLQQEVRAPARFVAQHTPGWPE